MCTLHGKKNLVIHIRNLKQALEHGLKLQKVHKAIAFHQEAWFKRSNGMNTELRKKGRMILKKTLTN